MPLPKDIQDRRKRAGVRYEDFWSVVTPNLIQYNGGGTYIYNTPQHDNNDTKPLGQIKTIEPMNTNDPFAINKFEVRIQKHQQPNTLVIGICDSLYNIEIVANDYIVAFNITDGLISTNNAIKANVQYNPCNEGDVIKFVVLSSSETDDVTIEVYCNDIRIAEFPYNLPNDCLHGVITLCSNNEEIVISRPERENVQCVDDQFEILTDFVCRNENGIYKYSESETPPDYTQTLAIGTVRSSNKIEPGTSSGNMCVQLLDRGRDSAIAIGLCSYEYPNDCMPGWKDDSAAYHVDMSCVLYGSDKKEMVDCLAVGDILFCRVEPVDGSTKEVMMFFEREGVIVSKSKMWCPTSGLHWCIGMMSAGEKVRIILPRKMSPIVLPTATFEDVWLMPLSNVRHVNNGTCVHDGTTGTGTIGTVRSKNPIDPLSAYPYYEVKVINTVTTNISLGVCEREYPYSEIPGLSGRSIGFNSFEGSINQGSILPDMTGSLSKPGDVIRCIVEAVDGSSKRVKVSFFVNSVLARSVIDWTPPEGFYAQICFFPSQEIQIACPLMRPSVLKRGISKPDYNWYECSLTLDMIEPFDTNTQPASIQPTSTQPTPNVTVSIPLSDRSLEKDGIVEKDGPLVSVPTVVIINESVSPCDHPLYRLMYNVMITDDGIVRNVNDREYGYVVCRKQVTEKLRYFEVEVVSIGQGGVAIGLSDGTLCANQCLGCFGNSIGLVSSSGTIVGGIDSSMVTIVTIKHGDVIGCLINDKDVSAKQSHQKNQNCTYYRKAYFYKNAMLIGDVTLLPSMIYSYPTVCLMDSNTQLNISFKYGLSPQSYFESHKITDGYLNIPMPDNGNGLKWRPIQNCTVIEDGREIFLSSSNDVGSPMKQHPPTIAQNNVSFSLNDSYFEIELLNPSSMYKTLSIGACPRILDSNNVHIPGEAENSVGFIPLSGLIMRSSEVASYASEYIVQQAILSNIGLLIGIGIRYLPSHPSDSALFFFTVNRQVVGQMVYSFRLGGLYPTLAFSYQNNLHHAGTGNKCPKLCKVTFPKPWPFYDTQIAPLGIGRISHNLDRFVSTYIADNAVNDSSANGIQSCVPVSPSDPYFEILVVKGGENFSISVGLAPPHYSLDQHIGLHYPSIGYHIGAGCLLHNGVSTVVSPMYSHNGLRIGCGAIFPEDGSRANAEIFFTVDTVMVSRTLISLPFNGLYPSFAMHTNGLGLLEYNLSPCNPHRHLQFSTNWHVLQNVLYSESKLQLISQTEIGLAQLKSVQTSSYVTFRFNNSSKTGKILIGFSNCSISPMSPGITGLNHSVYLDIISGTILLIRNGLRKSDDCVFPRTNRESVYGCGLKPFDTNSHSAILFFTINNQMIYSLVIDTRGLKLLPSVCLIGTSTILCVDACAIWLPMSSIGVGYGRHQNVKMVDGQYIAFHPNDATNRSKIGFAQSCSPFHPGWSYFEVEIISRDPHKALAVGLTSRRYDMKDWVGWKAESVGYHADDGKMFIANGRGEPFGPKLYEGDIVGCGVKVLSGCNQILENSKIEVFFVVNQCTVGTPKVITVPPGGLFPTVCMESPSEVVNVFFRAPQYTSSLNKMNRLWAKAVCVSQVGNVIEHGCGSRSSSMKQVKIPIGYCQAVLPINTRRRYFEIEIIDSDIKSNLSLGLAPLQPDNASIIVTCSIMFAINGQVSVKQSSSVFPNIISTQKCQIRDRIGCRVQYDSSSGQPESVAFIRNGVQLTLIRIPVEIKSLQLHPTILLPNGKDSVMVMLNASLPAKFSPRNHIGWINTERVMTNGSVVRYNGDTRGNVGIGQMSVPLCRQNPFFEIEVIDLGDQSCLSIGATALGHSFRKQPGWCAYSIGCHGDDGCLFNASGIGYSFGPSWCVGDIIGLGIRPYDSDVFPGTEVQAFFTRNGIEIGHATVIVPEGGFFPTIGFHSNNETVKVDIDCGNGYVNDLAKKTWRTLCGIELIQSPYHKNVSILRFLDLKRRTVCLLQFDKASNPRLGLAVSYQPFSLDMQYFEVEILKYGKNDKVSVGVVPRNYSPDEVIGWSKDSVAYYTHTGYLNKSSVTGKPFGPIAKVGDKIGCGYISDSNSYSLFFTLNGSTVGHKVKCPVPVDGFFPAIGLFSTKDKVSVKFNTTYKPSIAMTDSLVGLLRIQNCSYSDSLLLYTGGSTDGPAIANAHFAVSMSSARNYFSTCLTNLNDNVLVGLVTNDYPLNIVPGKQSFSVAYDVFSGKVESTFGKENVKSFVKRCHRGDVVGCGLSPSESKPTYFTFFFVVNGCIVHQLKLSQATTTSDWFPVVGFLPVRKQSSIYLDWSNPLYEAQNIL